MSTQPRDNFARPQASKPTPDDDRPLELEPDDENEQPAFGWSWSRRTADRLHRESAAETSALEAHAGDTVIDPNEVSVVDRSAVGSEAGHMSDVLRWALDSLHEPALAAADWLARDIAPEQPSASALLTNPEITLLQAKQAKSVFKTMRIVGEKSADRRIGARMYAAAIAAALVRHQRLISRQSPEALRRGFQGLLDDQRMPQPLRDLAGMAICVLNEKQYKVDAAEVRQPPVPHPANGKANGHGRKGQNGRNDRPRAR